MMNELIALFDPKNLNYWASAGAVFFLILFTGILIRRIVWRRLSIFVKTTRVTWDDQLLVHLSAPVTALIVVLAMAGATQASSYIVRTHPLTVFTVKFAAVLVTVWVFERLLTVLMRYSALPDSLNTTTRTLLLTISRVVLISIGLLVALDTVGVSITPLLASLGVGSVAVALALQDTLSNFFGGLYILVDKPIRIGDFVQIEDVEGVVDQIGWRSTRILLPSNHMVVVPNAKVAGSKLKNFDLPDLEVALVVDGLISFDSDLDQVEKIGTDVAREVMARVPGSVMTFNPVVRFNGFTELGVKFVAVMRVARHTDGFFLRHEFIKTLHARFAREGIVMPVPQRMLVVPTVASRADVQARPSGPPSPLGNA